MINRVNDRKRADYCDKLLTKLIQDERQYDKSIEESFVVKDFYNNVIQDDRNILLVYEDNNIIKGYIYLKPHNEQKDAYVIDALFVDEQFRNNGIAKELFKYTINLIKSLDIKHIYIDVIADNIKAYNLYKSIGFDLFKYNLKMDL